MLLLPLSIGCADRIRYQDSIKVPIVVAGQQAWGPLYTALPDGLIELFGNELPDPWPADAPSYSADLQVETVVRVRHDQLGEVGADLSQVAAGEAEIRLRHIDLTFDKGDLNLPAVSGQLWVSPDEEFPIDEAASSRVGYLTGLESGTGEVVFIPGGRRALQDFLVASSGALVLRVLLAFDTRENRALPAGEGALELDIAIDVLK